MTKVYFRLFVLSCSLFSLGTGTYAYDSAGLLHQLPIYHHWTGESCKFDVDAISLKLQHLDGLLTCLTFCAAVSVFFLLQFVMTLSQLQFFFEQFLLIFLSQNMHIALFPNDWGLMGIEFVSRQMEHPFGNDESDIPLSDSTEILQGVVVWDIFYCPGWYKHLTFRDAIRFWLLSISFKRLQSTNQNIAWCLKRQEHRHFRLRTCSTTHSEIDSIDRPKAQTSWRWRRSCAQKVSAGTSCLHRLLALLQLWALWHQNEFHLGAAILNHSDINLATLLAVRLKTWGLEDVDISWHTEAMMNLRESPGSSGSRCHDY